MIACLCTEQRIMDDDDDCLKNNMLVLYTYYLRLLVLSPPFFLLLLLRELLSFIFKFHFETFFLVRGTPALMLIDVIMIMNNDNTYGEGSKYMLRGWHRLLLRYWIRVSEWDTGSDFKHNTATMSSVVRWQMFIILQSFFHLCHHGTGAITMIMWW